MLDSWQPFYQSCKFYIAGTILANLQLENEENILKPC